MKPAMDNQEFDRLEPPGAEDTGHQKPTPAAIVKSFGMVFGDIGTSPIYTLTVTFALIEHTRENIVGVLSLVVWALVLLCTAQYAWLAMNLSVRGEGGAIVLRELVLKHLRHSKRIGIAGAISVIAISFFIGDGVITPAISILSAVEGVREIPALAHTPQDVLLLAACIIAVILFSVQFKGTGKVSAVFGPVMAVWFAVLAVSGAVSLYSCPEILYSLSPAHGIGFLMHHGFTGFLVLAEVILCATGSEAMYADMGHIGAEPIRAGWGFVFGALLLTYLGQGAYAINHPGAKEVLFEMVYSQLPILYIPFLLLGIAATVIASQAIITGMYSIIYQGIVTRLIPMMRVNYTSEEIKSQIYIPMVNWFLLFAVVYIMLEFGESVRLGSAYGLAVTGTMTISGIFMTIIFAYRGEKLHSAVAGMVTAIDLVFFLACTTKIPHGGYWSILIAFVPMTVITVYLAGLKKLRKSLEFMPLTDFLDKFKSVYSAGPRIPGTALYFMRLSDRMPPYIARLMFVNNIVYEDNVLVSVNVTEHPYGLKSGFEPDAAPGLRRFEVNIGYLEHTGLISMAIKSAGIREKSIFYGTEDIVTRKPAWIIFSILKRLSTPIVDFYQLPPDKIHGVVTRVEM